MSVMIYIDREGEQFGPYSIDQVSSYLGDGSLLVSDMAWHEGLNDWVPVSHIQGVILPKNRSSPPPSPSRERDYSNEEYDEDDNEYKKRGSAGIISKAIIGVLFVIFFGYPFYFVGWHVADDDGKIRSEV